MSEIKIEKGIPIPAQTSGQRVYPVSKMDVGDSFLVKTESQRGAALLSFSAAGLKATSRAVEGGYRIWRIK